MVITFQAQFDFGQQVYLRCNTDMCGTVVGYHVRPGDAPPETVVTWSDGETRAHQEFELIDEKPL